MYELLGQIYKEIFDMFDTDVFHMGGDEVQRILVFEFDPFKCTNRETTN